MYLKPYWNRALYRCDCCGVTYEGDMFGLRTHLTRKDYCRLCERAWLRFVNVLRLYMQTPP